MSGYSTLKTDPERIAFIKEKLSKDDRWIARGILALYSMQTPRERKKKATTNLNGKGFNSWDAECLTMAAKKLLKDGADHSCHSTQKSFYLNDYLSEKMIALLRVRMPKYAAQLLEHSVKSTYPK